MVFTKTLPALASAIVLVGCSAYRTDASVTTDDGARTHYPTETKVPANQAATSVQILEGPLPAGQKYASLGKIEVSVKKLTVFHKDPTREQANEALVVKARDLGANAVVNVKYESGIGMMTWGYIDASGEAVRFLAP